MKYNEHVNSIIGILLICLTFIAASYVVHNNSDFFKVYIHDDFSSRVLYVLLLVVSAVFAPVDLIFLLPLATSAWGWIAAGILSLIGWTIGSALVFFISRRYGAPLIKKHLPLEKIYKYEKFMPQKNIFTSIIFLRIAIPMDLISYSIGLFTNIKFMPYLLATFIGYIPLAFSLAYIGSLPTYMQVFSIIMFVAAVGLGFLSIRLGKQKMLDKQNKMKDKQNNYSGKKIQKRKSKK